MVEVSIVETLSQAHTDDLLVMYVVETLCVRWQCKGLQLIMCSRAHCAIRSLIAYVMKPVPFDQHPPLLPDLQALEIQHFYSAFELAS